MLVFGPVYLCIGGECPNPDETISSRVRRASVKGHWWGRALERLINGLFLLLTGQQDHCEKSLEALPPR